MNPTCDTKSLYESVEACPGKKTMPGIRRRLYFVPKSSIVKYPTLPNPGDENITMAALAQLKGDFTLGAGEYFRFIDLKDEASNVTYTSEGEDGSKVYNNQANAIVTGMEDAIKGFARQAHDDDLLYIYQDRSGKFCVLGNEAFKTHTTPNGDTGAEATGTISSTFAIQVYDECPVPTYVGKIPLSATTYIDAATGKEETTNGQAG